MILKITTSKTLSLLLFLFSITNVFASEFQDIYLPCSHQPKLQESRSKELKELVDADQKLRADWDNLSEDEKLQLVVSDRIRRMRVGGILGEGCFKTAEDYAAASLIYQHGSYHYVTYLFI